MSGASTTTRYRTQVMRTNELGTPGHGRRQSFGRPAAIETPGLSSTNSAAKPTSEMARALVPATMCEEQNRKNRHYTSPLSSVSEPEGCDGDRRVTYVSPRQAC
jgi:hypothetical protein